MEALHRQNNFLYEFGSWQFHVRNVLARALAPINCKLCGAETDGAISLCAACAEKIFDAYFDFRCENRQRFCRVCGKELISEQDICQRCKRIFKLPPSQTAFTQKSAHTAYSGAGTKNTNAHTDTAKSEKFFERNFSLFPYAGAGQKIVADWKNKAIRNYARFFASYLFNFLQNDTQLSQYAIVPVPARPDKLKQKGWDQINDLVYDLRLRGKKICKCLRRHNGVSQKAVNKKTRARNVRGKFYVKKDFIKKLPKHVILLDDIITTGATINECSKVLREAGCEKVFTVCLFFD